MHVSSLRATSVFPTPVGPTFFFSSTRRHTISLCDWSSDVCSSDLIHAATRHMLWELLDRGVNVYYQPPPFVHSKLFYVDDHYAQLGSANFHARSLRLNFEMNLRSEERRVGKELSYRWRLYQL